MLAETPTKYQINDVPTAPFLIIPSVSSERREYIPIGYETPPTVPSNATTILPNATLDMFGILTSAMHMAWLRCVGGRLESRYRYSVGLVFNAFPVPKLSKRRQNIIAEKAKDILDARKKHEGTSLAILYDPDLMPAELRIAHRELDKSVDRAYRKTAFRSERERLEHLFSLYEKIKAPLIGHKRKKSKKKLATST